MTNVQKLDNVNDKPVEEVVDVLERCLEKAKSGELRGVAVVGYTTGNGAYSNFYAMDSLELLGHLDFAKALVLRTLIPPD